MNFQVKATVSRLRAGNIKAIIRGDRIVFTGGKYGEHSLAVEDHITSAERLVKHWEGYLETNGLDPRTTVGSCFWYDGRGHKPNARVIYVERYSMTGSLLGRCIYKDGRVGKTELRLRRAP